MEKISKKQSVLIFALLGFICSMQLNAQKANQGTITYEDVFKMEINLDSLPEEIRGMMPTETKSEMTLYFNESTSIYQPSASKEEEISESGEGGMVVISMGGGSQNICYRNLTGNKVVQQVDFMDRTFLIEDEFTKREWKMTGGQKMIGGDPCLEATSKEKEDLVTAWFCPGIPVSAGPEDYGGLPGMILAISTNNGDRTITAKSVDLKEIEKDKIVKPTKGKKMTTKEFEEMVMKKTEEMGGSSEGGNVRVVIKTVTQ